MTSQRPGAADADAVVLAFMIADIRGYSRFSRERGDAAAAALAKRFADVGRDAVEARSGRVVELRGDEVFAAFPSAAEAVLAAVELQLSCAEESESDPSLPLLVGIGIDVGPAVPVEDGYRGVAINLAARLCNSAGAGQVLVTATAAEQSHGICGDVELNPHGTSTFKGFDEPVSIVEARARWDAVPVEDRSTGGEPLPPELIETTPLVGRTHEMRWLRGTWRQVRRGRGRVVAIDGPAGIGKTRLAAEIASHVLAFGGTTRYAGPGGLAAATALNAVSEAQSARTPSLVVIDQLDVVGPDVVDAIAEAMTDVARLPVLVLLLLRDAAASSPLAALVERCAADSGHRRLGTLSPAEVGDIVALYAGDATDDAPLEMIVRASRGIPALVHERASEWARSETSRRLEAAAGFMAAARERRSADLEFANNVIGLKLGRLYAPDRAPLPSDIEELGPYKGLASFDQDDAAWFFGREQLVGELAARVVASGALAIVGASGSGKSSVVAAGLLPSLRAGLLPGSGRWSQAQMRPGEHPLAALRAALASQHDDPIAAAIGRLDDNGRLVLVVDQFEEVFITCDSDAERSEFLDLLATHAARDVDQFAAVVTLRSDFYGHLAEFPALAALLADNHVLVGSLTRADLHRVVQLPAQRAGVRIETALVEALVEEADGEPGALPLLSTALVELWQARSGGWIRAAAYHQGGGIRGAVARLAEASYAQLDEADQGATRRVLLRLASSADGETATRRRVELDEFDLDRDAGARRVIDRFTTDRLLTVSGSTIEVAHEALLREWPRLRDWLDEDVHGRQLSQHLTLAAKGWQAAGREPSEVYRGARLSAALEWAGNHSTDLNDLERAFLNASREASEAESDKTRRSNRRLRRIAIALAAVVVLAVAGGLIALHERSTARTQADHAEQAALTADARRLAALSANAPDIATSSLLAVAAYRLQDSADTRGALLTAVERNQSALWRKQFGHRPQVVVATPSNSAIAVNDNTYEARIIDPRTHEQVAHFPTIGFLDGITADGRSVVAFGPTNTEQPHTQVTAYEVPSGKPHVLATVTGDAASSAMTSDGRWLAVDTTSTTDGPHTIDVFDLQHPAARPGHFATTGPLAGIGAGRSAVAVEYRDGSVDEWALPSLRISGRLPAATSSVTNRLPTTAGATGAGIPLAVSPDGSKVARIDPADERRAVLYQLGSGTRSGVPLPTAPQPISIMSFAPDGSELAVASQSGSLAVYATDGSQVASYAGHDGPLHGMSWAGESAPTALYTVGLDGDLVSWDLDTGTRTVRQFGADRLPPIPHAGLFGSLMVDDAGGPSTERSTRRMFTFDLKTHKYASWRVGLVDANGNTEGVAQISASANGTYAIANIQYIFGPRGGTNRAEIYDMRTHRAIGQLAVPHAAFFPDGFFAAVSPDGRSAYCNCSSTHNDEVDVFALPSGTLRSSFRVHFTGPDSNKVEPECWRFDPAGRLVVAGWYYGTTHERLGLIDVSTHTLRAQVDLGAVDPPTTIAWSADRRTMALGGYDGSVQLHDAATLRVRTAPVLVTSGAVNTLSFAPDGQTLLVGGSDGYVRFLSLPDLSPQGQRVPAGTDQIWAWYDANGDVVGLAPDARSTANGYRWFRMIAAPNELARIACGLVGTDITRAQWQRYVGDRPYRHVCPTAP